MESKTVKHSPMPAPSDEVPELSDEPPAAAGVGVLLSQASNVFHNTLSLPDEFYSPAALTSTMETLNTTGRMTPTPIPDTIINSE